MGGAKTARPVRRGQVLVGLLLAMALAAMDATIVATAVPSIVADLGGFSLFPWVFSVYLLTQAVTTPIYGKLSDLYGRRPVLLTGMGVFLAGAVLCGLAPGMGWLIVFRGVQGIGAGAIQPVALTIVGDLYTAEERGRIQGWLSSVWGISAVVGPAVGGLLAQYATWRWIFYLNLPVGAAALLLVASRLHEDVARGRRPVDWTGAVLLVAGSGLLILGLLTGGVDWPWLSAPSLAVFGGALAAVGGFVWQERRAPEPMLPLWLFRRRVLVGAGFGAAAIGFLTVGVSAFLPVYAQGVLGAPPVLAGFAVAAVSLGWSTGSPLSTRLYLRLGFRDTAMGGLALCLLAGVLFARLSPASSVGQATGASVVMGLGLGLVATPLIVGIQSVVGWERRGVVTGANMFIRILASAVGAAVFGGVANWTLAGWLGQAPPDLAGRLPATVDEVSRALTGAAERVQGPAGDYLRQGLYLATHRVFWGLAVVAAAGLVALSLTPRRFAPLRVPGEAAGGTAPPERATGR